MKMNFSNSGDLLKNAQESQLYYKLVEQLQKDFGLANIAFRIDCDMSSEELQKALREKMYYLIMERFSEYLNLLYVVDVPEKAFKYIDGTDVVEVAEQVSFLILKREMQKVRSKAKYT